MTFLDELYAIGTLTDDHDTEYGGTIYTTPSLIDHDDGKKFTMTKTPCPDCNGDGATYEQVRVGQTSTPFVCFRCDGEGEVTDPNIPIGEVEVHALRERLAQQLARTVALQDALDKELLKAKAEALREAASAVDLDKVAEEWSQGPGNRDDMHWAAGNAASSVVIALHDRATGYERESEHGVVR